MPTAGQEQGQSSSDGAPLASPGGSRTEEMPLTGESQASSQAKAGSQQPKASFCGGWLRQADARSEEIAIRLMSTEDSELSVALEHGKACGIGLVIVQVMRMAAWKIFGLPGESVVPAHLMSTGGDLVCLLINLPVLIKGPRGLVLGSGYVGPMLTATFLILFMSVLGLCVHLSQALPQPVACCAPSYLDAFQATISIWEMALVASVATQIALLVSCWRLYRNMRVVGLYPPGRNRNVDPARVSVLEMVCDESDAKSLLASCNSGSGVEAGETELVRNSGEQSAPKTSQS